VIRRAEEEKANGAQLNDPFLSAFKALQHVIDTTDAKKPTPRPAGNNGGG
jgi:hypothetical protein